MMGIFYVLVANNADALENKPSNYVMLEAEKLLGQDFLFMSRVSNIGMFPPLEVMKDYFQKDNFNHGMSGYQTWKPYELTEENYNYLIEYFSQTMVLDKQYDDLKRIKRYDHWISRSFRYVTKKNVTR